MANPSESGRPTYELAVLVVRRLLTEPGVWSARTLAGELGEYERRVQRVVAALPGAGWQVERDEGARLTVRV